MMACTPGSKRLRDYEEKNLPLKKRPVKETPYMDTTLLVDDDIPSRLIEQSMLASLGIDTLAVNNVHDGITILGVGSRFDFIIADFDLAIINGPQFVRQIRTMGVQSKILGMCTNYTTENTRMFFEAGANACIEKPIDPESLEEAIGYLRNL